MTARRRKPMPGNGAAPTTVRCAIYTRKSTERGLEQEFNSLDAQRAAGEAHIASLKGEGWVCLLERYDDGGFSGGSMERPALVRLMAEVEAEQVDAVVVYKLDRLSRSLLDFTRIMETLDRHRVAFVSVTESFNTKTSMGRMVLNMLAIFAQFEREQISDRTRDKMSAARRRGKWVGGNPILGYDLAPEGGRILINKVEAEQVRQIYGLYLKTSSTVETLRELARRGCIRKRWVTRGGQERGGEPFDKPRLLYLLKNPAYVGKVCYDGVLYPGEHEAILDEETWQRVQAVIRRNGATAGGAHRNKSGALLKGILRCAPCNRAMIYSWTGKNGKRYPYYVCTRAQREGWSSCPTKSVPAVEIERFVLEQVRAIGTDPNLVARVVAEVQAAGVWVEESEIGHALEEFTPMWDGLSLEEQGRMLGLLVEHVLYDGAAEQVSLTYRPSGIRALVEGGA